MATNWLELLTGETRLRMLALLRRAPHTITGLSQALGLTDNAVRLHIATLERDGMVEDVGAERGTGGKPARLYGLSRAGEEMFPKAYARVLDELVGELVRRDGRAHALALLRAVGRRAAGDATVPGDFAGRVEAGAQLLRGLGGDVEVQPEGKAWRIQGYGCPLSAVTSEHAEVCALVQALLETVTEGQVTECCDRSDRPRCAFTVRKKTKRA